MQDVCVDEVSEKKQGKSMYIVKIHIAIKNPVGFQCLLNKHSELDENKTAPGFYLLSQLDA